MRAIRHRANRVLEEPRVVTHRQEMTKSNLWCSGAAVGHGRTIGVTRNYLAWIPAPGLLKDGKVFLCGSLPGHRAAACVSALAHPCSPVIVSEQCRDLGADGLRIAEGHEHASPVGQQFARVP